MKENDWLVLGMTNPEISTNEFLISGINLSNTQFLDKDTYKKSLFILDQFTKDGVFDDKAFTDLYNQRAKEFKNLLQLHTVDNFEYNPFDPRATSEKLVKSPNLKLYAIPNPTKTTTTFTNDVYEGTRSMREAGLASHVWDNETNTWSDDTLNDRTLEASLKKWIKLLTEEPLVYATYDSDGTHFDPFTGREVEHVKGQYKLNQQGNPYAETLNGRSLIGKKVVSSGDLLTIDGSKANHYDFIDSDGLDKSVGGTIVKATAAIAPMLIPYADVVYSGLLVGREILKTLPMLYGMISPWLDLPEENKTLNNLAAWGEKFTSSTSDYSELNLVTTENIANLITDVVTLWGQQLFIAKSISKLRGTNKLTLDAFKLAQERYAFGREALRIDKETGRITLLAFDKYAGDIKNWQNSILGKSAIEAANKSIENTVKKANRLGADLSLAYMALVSNTDVYNSMIENGASRKEAAAVALGSTLGMFSVDRYAHLGELFYDDLNAPVEYQIRNALKKNSESWYKNVLNEGSVTDVATKKGIKGLIKKGIELGKQTTNKYIEDLKYHTTGFWGKALGEGLEEVSEELVSDTMKGLYELAGFLGADTQTDNVGAFENVIERYGMSLFGGAVGGGLFYGIDLAKHGKFSIDRTQDELEYIIRNGRTDELLKTIEEWNRKGKFGSTDLSTQTTNDGENNTFLTAQNKEDSQNDFIYRRIKETVLSLDNIINANEAKLSDDDLFYLLILKEERFRNFEEYLLLLKADFSLLEFSYTTGYQRDYLKALHSVIDLEVALKQANLTKSGIFNALNTDDIATDEWLRHASELELKSRNNNLKKLEDKLNNAKEHLKRFLSGEYSIDYTEKMLVALDLDLNRGFVAMTFDQWLDKNYDGKTYEELSPSELESLKSKYIDYRNSALKLELDELFRTYKIIKDKANPYLLTLSENLDLFLKSKEYLDKLFNDVPNLKFYKFDDILDFEEETEESESYINRGQDPNRNERIYQKNLEIIEEYFNQINENVDKAGGYIDPNTRRKLKLGLNKRNKDIYKDILNDLRKDFDDTKQEIYNAVENLDVNDPLFEGNVINVVESIIKSKAENQNSLDNEIKDALYDLVFKYSLGYETLSEMLSYDTTFKYLADLTENPEKFKNDLERENFSDDLIELAISKLSDILNLYILGENVDTMLDRTNSDSLIDKYTEIYINTANEIINEVNNNRFIQLNKELDAKVSDINPVIDLVKNIGLSLNKNMDNLESILLKIDTRYEQGLSREDFQLTQEEEESFIDAAYLINLTLAYLSAASSSPTFFAPFGHNQILNEFASNHKDIYKDYLDLPVLSPDVAEAFIDELNKYLNLIGVFDNKSGTFNLGSYLDLSTQNKANKAQKFIKGEKALYKALYDFSFMNRNAFKFDDIDLLEGFDEISGESDSLLTFSKIHHVYYNNVKKYLDSGHTFEDFWKKMSIIIKSPEEVLKQKTSKLDEQLEVGKLTDFDKVTFLTSLASIDPYTFYHYLKTRINYESDIVPLTIQEWLSQIGISMLDNSKNLNETLEYFVKEAKDIRPIIKNAIFISGNGGAGKSRVIAKNIANYKDKVWLSAPVSTLIATLFSAVGKGELMLNESELTLGADKSKSLLERIGVNMKDYLNAVEDLNNYKLDSKFFTMLRTPEALIIRINDEIFKLPKLKEAPDIIIIDEATHLNSIALLILSKFAEINPSTKLVFLGDDKLLGFSGLGKNINRENVIILRTPNLGITLRDANVLHSENLNSLAKLIDSLNNLDESDTSYKIKVSSIKAQIPNLNFRVYDKDDINGDLITKELTDDIISKFKEKSKIGYIGINSSIINKLKDSGFEVLLLTKKSILGQEFDYVVIDEEFNPDFKNELGVFNFLTDLYTMISRSTEGTVIIDRNENLLEIIGKNRIDTIKAKSPSITTYLSNFLESKLKVIDQILSTIKPSEETSEPSSKPTIKPEPVIKDDDVGPEIIEKEESSIEPIIDNSEDFTPSEEIISPILGYGSMTFTGMLREDTGKTVKGVKEYRLINPKSEIKRDLQLFTNDNVDPLDLARLFKLLLEFKRAFLYDKKYDELNDNIKNIISEDLYNNIKWKIVIREIDPNLDNFIRNINVSEVKGIGDKNLLFTVVGEFKTKDGSNGLITLGLLSDPETLKQNIENIKQKYLKEIDKQLNIIDTSVRSELKETARETIAILEEKINSLKSKSSEYEDWVRNKSNEYIGTPLSYDIDILFLGLTKLRKRDNKKPILRVSRFRTSLLQGVNKEIKRLKDLINSYAPGNELIRLLNLLDELLKKKSLWEARPEVSFQSIHPNSVISPMYIVSSSPSALISAGISSKIIGKSVVFVSNDTSLKPEDLLLVYTKLKTDQAEGKSSMPKVRMIILNNVGVSFLDLTNPYMQDMMYSKTKSGITNIFPFEQGPMGARMFVGMWNFRANLLRFNDLLLDFINTVFEGNIDKLNNILYDMNIKWRVDEGKATDLELLYYNNNKTRIDSQRSSYNEIEEFNTRLDENVKLFRLGTSSKNGAYIRKIKGSKKFYGDSKNINGIYINPIVTEKYLSILDSLFKDIIDPIIDIEGLDPKKLISVNKGNSNSINFEKNSISGKVMNLLRTKSITINDIYEDGNSTIVLNPAYSDEVSLLSAFAHIPAVLSKIYKNIRLQTIGEEFYTFDFSNPNVPGSISLKWDDNIRTLDYGSLLKTLGIDTIDSRNQNRGDNTLSNLFSFMFHGTLEDVNKSVLKASDALFPNGFYVDPMASGEDPIIGLNGLSFKLSILNPWYFSSDVEVDDPTFLVDLNKATPTVELSIKPTNESINLEIEKAIKELPLLEGEFKEILTEEDYLDSNDKLKYIQNRIDEIKLEYIKDTTNEIFNGTFKNSIDKNTILLNYDKSNKPYHVTIENLLKDFEGNILSVTRNNKLIEVISKTDVGENIYIITRDSNNILHIKTESKSVDDDLAKSVLEKIANLCTQFNNVPRILNLSEGINKLAKEPNKLKIERLILNFNNCKEEVGINQPDMIEILNTIIDDLNSLIPKC